MFRKDQFGIVFNTIFSIFFSLVITAFILFRQDALGAESLATGFVSAFAVNFTLGSFIPLVKVGNAFASLFTKNEKSIIFYLLRMFMIVLIMTAGMSFIMMFLEMGFSAQLLPAFVFSLPVTFAFAYVVAALCFPLLLKLTQALCSKSMEVKK